MRTFSLHFYLKPQKARKDGTVPIYARIILDKKRVEIATKRHILPAEWDKKREAPTGRKAADRELASFLEAFRTKAFHHYQQLNYKDDSFTIHELKGAILGIRPSNSKTFMEVFRYHNDRMRELVGKDYAKGTLTRFETAQKHLQAFLAHQYQIEDIFLDKLNLGFINDYDHYLRSVRGIGNNTTVKYIACTKKIVLLAIENGWLEKDPFTGYKGRLRTVDRGFLEPEELEAIRSKHFHTPRLSVVRDIFLFACYTGLAYSDVSKLKEDDLVLAVDGQRWIHLNRTKTDTKSYIPLLPQAQELIEKYRNHPESQIKGTIFPIRTNQKMNAYLKEIADLCGITKRLTFHIARHTFATTVTLSNGVPIESVSAMLGHKDIKTTQHYAKIVQRKVGDDMKALQEKLSGKKDKDPKIRKIS
ncbi:MAG: site-specific integrase [Bacteroidota bacterium]